MDLKEKDEGFAFLRFQTVAGATAAVAQPKHDGKGTTELGGGGGRPLLWGGRSVAHPVSLLGIP